MIHEALTERAALRSSSPHIAFVKDLRLLFSLKHMNNYSAMYAQTEKGLGLASLANHPLVHALTLLNVLLLEVILPAAT